ncbi:MAG: hypothetical protein U0Y68_24950 [Blastocatellia bacterium]
MCWAIGLSGGRFLERDFQKIQLGGYGIGAGAVLVEIGFLLAYRQGWQISVTSMLVNMVISLVLVPVGLLAYKEKISTECVGNRVLLCGG